MRWLRVSLQGHPIAQVTMAAGRGDCCSAHAVLGLCTSVDARPALQDLTAGDTALPAVHAARGGCGRVPDGRTPQLRPLRPLGGSSPGVCLGP